MNNIIEIIPPEKVQRYASMVTLGSPASIAGTLDVVAHIVLDDLLHEHIWFHRDILAGITH